MHHCFLRGWSLVGLQNPLLNEIIRLRAGLESVVDFILELSTLQLFSCSLESGGYGVIFEDVLFDQFLFLRSVADGLA